jgi:enoyl-CoA hydratase
VTNFVTIEKGLGPEGRIAVVRFDRGDGINALSPEAMRQLTSAARSFEDDGDTSVVVLTGGPKAFSAGFDLKDAEGRLRKSMDLGSLRRHLKIGPGSPAPGRTWNRSRSPRSKASVSVAASRSRSRSIFVS